MNITVKPSVMFGFPINSVLVVVKNYEYHPILFVVLDPEMLSQELVNPEE